MDEAESWLARAANGWTSQLRSEPGFEPVAGFLRPHEPDRLYQLAARLADLFDQYQVYRADWLDDWEAGRDHLRVPGRPDLALPADQRWQPALWRALIQELDEAERACIRPRLHGRPYPGRRAGFRLWHNERPWATPTPTSTVS